MPVVMCPGMCGLVVAGEMAEITLATHLLSCQKGISAMERMRLFCLWLLERIDGDHESVMADEGVSGLPELSRALVGDFLGVVTSPSRNLATTR